MFQITHNLGIRDKANKCRIVWVFKEFLTGRIIIYRFVSDFVPLNETTFESSESLLTWVQTCIWLNNIETLIPEDWFKEGHGMQI